MEFSEAYFIAWFPASQVLGLRGEGVTLSFGIVSSFRLIKSVVAFGPPWHGCTVDHEAVDESIVSKIGLQLAYSNSFFVENLLVYDRSRGEVILDHSGHFDHNVVYCCKIESRDAGFVHVIATRSAPFLASRCGKIEHIPIVSISPDRVLLSFNELLEVEGEFLSCMKIGLLISDELSSCRHGDDSLRS